MNIKQLVITVLVATVICWLTWLVIILQVDPTTSGIFGFILFYLSWFFSLLGTFFLITFGFRKLINRSVMEYKIVGMSFRQSFFFSLLLTTILFLQSVNLLTWWNIVLLIAALTILEFFFLTYKNAR